MTRPEVLVQINASLTGLVDALPCKWKSQKERQGWVDYMTNSLAYMLEPHVPALKKVAAKKRLEMCDKCGHRHFNMEWGGYEDCPTCTYGCERDGRDG